MANACLIIIGNEILSGRTQDKNTQWLAKGLNEAGITLRHVRVIPDVEHTIIDTVNECREAFDYVFTTGGIGPTHDDITSLSVAKAFGVELLRNAEAERRLRAHYTEAEINEARLSMANIPSGAELIDNPVSAAPGFYLDNVFVLAGVPVIAQAMFGFVAPLLKGGKPTLSRAISVWVSEGVLAEGLTTIQNRYPEVDIGSYPMIKDGKLATSLVLRHADEALLSAATEEVEALLTQMGGKRIETI